MKINLPALLLLLASAAAPAVSDGENTEKVQEDLVPLSHSGALEANNETTLPVGVSSSSSPSSPEQNKLTVTDNQSTTPTLSYTSPIPTTLQTEPHQASTEQEEIATTDVTVVEKIVSTTEVQHVSESQPVVSTSNNPSSTTIVETTTEEQMGFIDILGEDKEESSAVTDVPAQNSTSDSSGNSTSINLKERRQKLSDQIRAVIKHYREYGTVSVPDPSIPDPMVMPTIRKTFSGNDMTFTNSKVYGLSNFTIEHVNTDLDKMQVYVAIYMKKLVILGNYTAKFFFKKVSGPYNVTLLYVEASGAAALVRDKDGNLQASESEMDMTFMDSKVKFGNMGIMGALLQGMAASAGPVLFESIKPIILTEINQKVREDLNKRIKTIGSKFTETGTKPPLDVALEEGRRYVRENGYDPYVIDNYVFKYSPTNNSIFKVHISRLALTGLSNFRRVGEVSLSMDSGTVQMGIHLATSKLRGKCTWSLQIGQFQRTGLTNFTVDYVQGRGFVNQSLDVSKHPVLEDLDVNVGKVRIQMKGTGPFDLVLEALVNTLPDLIRHIIVDAIELPLKYAIQHILSEINVEEVLEKQLPELDKMGL